MDWTEDPTHMVGFFDGHVAPLAGLQDIFKHQLLFRTEFANETLKFPLALPCGIHIIGVNYG